MSTAERPSGPVANGTANGYPAGGPGPAEAAVVQPAPLLDLGKARAELQCSTAAQRAKASALSCGARALASYLPAANETPDADDLQRFCDGEAFRKEAFGHAALADDTGALLGAVRAGLDAARSAAVLRLQVALAFHGQ